MERSGGGRTRVGRDRGPGRPGRVIAVLGAWVLAAGCASSDPSLPPAPSERVVRIDGRSGGTLAEVRLRPTDGVSERTVPATVAETWAALDAAWADLELPATLRDPASGRLANEGLRARRIAGSRPSRFLNCGTGLGGPTADRYEVTVVLDSTVRPDAQDPGAAVVRVRFEGVARPPGRSGAATPCGTTGVLEMLLLDRVAERLAGPGAGVR